MIQRILIFAAIVAFVSCSCGPSCQAQSWTYAAYGNAVEAAPMASCAAPAFSGGGFYSAAPNCGSPAVSHSGFGYSAPIYAAPVYSTPAYPSYGWYGGYGYGGFANPYRFGVGYRGYSRPRYSFGFY